MGGNGASPRSAGKGVNGAPEKMEQKNGVAYPYVASQVLTDLQDDMQESLQCLTLTSEGNIFWGRLEGLIDQ